MGLMTMVAVATMAATARETTHIHEHNGLTGENVQEVYTDKQGLTWMGTNEGVCCYNGADVVYFGPNEAGAQQSVAHVIEMPDGTIVLGTRGGLCRIDIEKQCYTVVTEEVGIINALCLVNDTLVIGSRNGLWVYHNVRTVKETDLFLYLLKVHIFALRFIEYLFPLLRAGGRLLGMGGTSIGMGR